MAFAEWGHLHGRAVHEVEEHEQAEQEVDAEWCRADLAAQARQAGPHEAEPVEDEAVVEAAEQVVQPPADGLGRDEYEEDTDTGAEEEASAFMDAFAIAEQANECTAFPTPLLSSSQVGLPGKFVYDLSNTLQAGAGGAAVRHGCGSAGQPRGEAEVCQVVDDEPALRGHGLCTVSPFLEAGEAHRCCPMTPPRVGRWATSHSSPLCLNTGGEIKPMNEVLDDAKHHADVPPFPVWGGGNGMTAEFVMVGYNDGKSRFWCDCRLRKACWGFRRRRATVAILCENADAKSDCEMMVKFDVGKAERLYKAAFEVAGFDAAHEMLQLCAEHCLKLQRGELRLA